MLDRNRIKFLDLFSINNRFRKDFEQSFNVFLDSPWIILSEKVNEFESSFSKYIGVKHCIGTGNGLDALEIVLESWGIGDGDEVIVPANTYVATWLAITRLKATPVPVEPCEDTFNIDPDRIEEKITNNTKAIVVVHLYGLPCDMLKIKDISNKYSIKVLEDAAQSHGALYRGERCGSLADAAAFSFYPGKNLGCLGDGGCITTSDDKLEEKARLCRNYGSKIKYYNDIIGRNSRLDELQAYFLNCKLPYLDEDNDMRRILAAIYLNNIKETKDVKLPGFRNSDFEHIWHLFVILCPRRDELADFLLANGIETMKHYPIPPYKQKAYSSLNINPNDFPITNHIHDCCLSLPMGPTLKTDEAYYISKCINSFSGLS